MDYSKNPDNYYININKDHHPIFYDRTWAPTDSSMLFVSDYNGVAAKYGWEYDPSYEGAGVFRYLNTDDETGEGVEVYVENASYGEPVYSDPDLTNEVGKVLFYATDGDSVNVSELQNTDKTAFVTNDAIKDVPSDDKTYGRKNRRWVEITGGGGGGGNVDDVKVNGASVVTNKTATIPNATPDTTGTTGKYGVVKLDNVRIDNQSAAKTQDASGIMTGYAVQESIVLRKVKGKSSIYSAFITDVPNGSNAIAFGKSAAANNNNEVGLGNVNRSVTGSGNVGTIFTVGDGNTTASNILEQKLNGDLYIQGLGGFTGANSNPTATTADTWLKESYKTVKPLQDVIARDEKIINDYTLQDVTNAASTFVGDASTQAKWEANKYYDCGTLASTNSYVFKPKPFDKAIGTKCYVAQFSTGATVPTIVFPTSYVPSTASSATRTLKWQDVEIQPNKTYEISVINGAGVIVEI